MLPCVCVCEQRLARQCGGAAWALALRHNTASVVLGFKVGVGEAKEHLLELRRNMGGFNNEEARVMPSAATCLCYLSLAKVVGQVLHGIGAHDRGVLVLQGREGGSESTRQSSGWGVTYVCFVTGGGIFTQGFDAESHIFCHLSMGARLEALFVQQVLGLVLCTL